LASSSASPRSAVSSSARSATIDGRPATAAIACSVTGVSIPLSRSGSSR
jgi:hypothetical protein